MKHWFELTLKEWDRTMTKATYKEVHRFLRITRNVMEQDGIYEKLDKAVQNVVLYGTAVI